MLSAPLLPIGLHDIDLWLADEAAIVDPLRLAAMRSLLTDAERAQEQRFHFAHDRQRYLVTRAMVRTVLSRYASVAPADWQFTVNAYGRPAIDLVHGEAAGLLDFNLSHTRGLIALGVTRDRAIGVDVERVQPRDRSDGIAERFFSPSEAAELANVPSAGHARRFFEYWTFKESYIKARGKGLSIPLDEFGFEFPDTSTVRLNIAPSLGDDPGRWRFWQCSPRPNCLLALCAEQAEATPLPVVRVTVPTASEEILTVGWLRQSSRAAG